MTIHQAIADTKEAISAWEKLLSGNPAPSGELVLRSLRKRLRHLEAELAEARAQFEVDLEAACEANPDKFEKLPNGNWKAKRDQT